MCLLIIAFTIGAVWVGVVRVGIGFVYIRNSSIFLSLAYLLQEMLLLDILMLELGLLQIKLLLVIHLVHSFSLLLENQLLLSWKRLRWNIAVTSSNIVRAKVQGYRGNELLLMMMMLGMNRVWMALGHSTS